MLAGRPDGRNTRGDAVACACGVAAWRRRTRPTAPVAASTYQGPVSPRMMAESGGRFGGRLAWKARSSPRTSGRLLACQRALPSRGSRPRTEATPPGATETRLLVPAPSILAMIRLLSLLARSARMRAGVVVAIAPVRSPINSVLTKQAWGSDPRTQLEHEILALTCGGCRQGAEKTGLLGAAQRRKTGRARPGHRQRHGRRPIGRSCSGSGSRPGCHAGRA